MIIIQLLLYIKSVLFEVRLEDITLAFNRDILRRLSLSLHL